MSTAPATAKSSSDRKFRYYDIAILGTVTVMGGQYYGWSIAFKHGFGTYAVTQFLMGLAYICYVACASEIVSTIGFSGGAYGLARAVLGFYPGYIVGCIECIEYVSFSAAAILWCAKEINKTDHWLEILLCALQFALAYFIVTLKGNSLLYSLNIMCVLCTVPMLMFCFGSWKDSNFLEYASTHASPHAASPENWFVGNYGTGMLAVLPFTTWAYAGVESMALMSYVCEKPRVDVPWGMLYATLILFAFNILSMFCFASLPPGILTTASDDNPMSKEFVNLFRMTFYEGGWLVVPAVFGMALGFVMPYAKLLQSMADSNLMPSWFMLQGQVCLSRATIVGSVLGFIFCCFGYAFEPFESALANMSIISGFLTYLAQLVGFICIRVQYRQLRPEFKNPLGIPGAIYAMTVFSVGIISVAGFQNDNGIAVLSLVGLIFLISIYYFASARYHERLSPDEFKFRVLKFNMKAGKKAEKRSHESTFIRILATVWDFIVLTVVYVGDNKWTATHLPILHSCVRSLVRDNYIVPNNATPEDDEDVDMGDYDFAVPAIWGLGTAGNASLASGVTNALSSKGALHMFGNDDDEYDVGDFQYLESNKLVVPPNPNPNPPPDIGKLLVDDQKHVDVDAQAESVVDGIGIPVV